MAVSDSVRSVVDGEVDAAGGTASSNPSAASLLVNPRRVCLKILKSQRPLLLVLSSLGLAVVFPFRDAAAMKVGNTALVFMLFLAVGFVIPIKELAKGATALHLHLLCQVLCFLVIPSIYYFLVYRWHWARSVGILSDAFGVGVMAALCLPTTTTTCVLFVQKSRGDESLAAVNAVLGNLLGAGVSPVLASMFIGGEIVAAQNTSETLLQLSYQIVVPMVVGLVAQVATKRFDPELLPRGIGIAKSLLDLILWLATYFIFSSCFAGGTHGLEFQTIGIMVVWVVIIHVFLLAACWTITLVLCLRLKQRIAVAIVCSQKTEGMGIAILSIIFADEPDLGLYTLPVATYHTVQMMIAAVLCGRLAWWVDEEEKRAAVALQASEGKADLQADAHVATLLDDHDADAS
eukprot:TRINITY_DN75089_c0_g1_i1.p1 TRINITY_DN75089_c0_g1~~TRINITY_DN75089_c0_g1_i1.p1  ORF type:complete len:404 (+),score=55.47 TRINITY_DN75089_c0_g1_i1:71-1282(+)